MTAACLCQLLKSSYEMCRSHYKKREVLRTSIANPDCSCHGTVRVSFCTFAPMAYFELHSSLAGPNGCQREIQSAQEVRKEMPALAFLAFLRHSGFSKLRIANGWTGFDPHLQHT